MASSVSNILNNRLRLSGMASGLDTDTMVKQLMSVEKAKVDRVKQGKDQLEWKRDNYRDITNTLRSFQDEFFNFLKPSNNMRSLNTYSIYNVDSSTPAVATAAGGADATSTSHTIEVLALAKAATGASTAAVTKGIESNEISDFNIDGYNKTLIISYNGVNKEIVIPDGSYANAAAVLGDGSDGKLRQLVQQAFNGNVTVSEAGGKLQFVAANATDVITITNKTMPGDNLLNTLGLSSNGMGTTLNFASPIQIKKGMKFEITATEGAVNTSKTIQWDMDKSYNSINDLVSDLQTKLDATFGAAGKVNVSSTDNKLVFAAGAGVDGFSLSNSDVLKDLGVQNGASNKLSLSDTMDKVSSKLAGGGIIFDLAGKLKLTINNTNIEINKTDTLSSLISKVNNSTAGVNLSYSTYTDTFNITAKDTGAGTISINDNGSGFFTMINLNPGIITPGQDSSFKIDGLDGARRTNSFTADGVTYNLVSQGSTKITLTQNSEEIFNKIKAFVEKYNEVIGKINGEIAEKHERNYKPLTADQRESMSEEEIKRWEEKAKTGLLRSDGILNNMVINMRTAMSDAIQDITGGLSSIGITTGNYLDKGKLTIDESKLKDAIKNNSSKVISIFTKESSITYSDTINGLGSKTDRYKQNGIVSRIYDILQDNIRTTRDNKGIKGLLLEKAGIVGDLSEFKNFLNEEIDKQDKIIDNLTEKLYSKEDAYYRKFTALEKAMSQMNSQSGWLAQQFGGGQ